MRLRQGKSVTEIYGYLMIREVFLQLKKTIARLLIRQLLINRHRNMYILMDVHTPQYRPLIHAAFPSFGVQNLAGSNEPQTLGRLATKNRTTRQSSGPILCSRTYQNECHGDGGFRNEWYAGAPFWSVTKLGTCYRKYYNYRFCRENRQNTTWTTPLVSIASRMFSKGSCCGEGLTP
jgi:hypothetical protein